MPNIEIKRPNLEDIDNINDLFTLVITDTFIKEGIGDKLDDIEEEIRVKRKYLESDFKSDGKNRYFLIAYEGDRIIGSIEYGPASNLINTCTNNALVDLVEIGTVFVHPSYQRRGVGSSLLSAIIEIIKDRGVEEFCLDSGYTIAQKVWKKKFGEPDYLLKDYWGTGYDHMIWRIKIRDLDF